jgi:hypothetical protein
VEDAVVSCTEGLFRNSLGRSVENYEKGMSVRTVHVPGESRVSCEVRTELLNTYFHSTQKTELVLKLRRKRCIYTMEHCA